MTDALLVIIAVELLYLCCCFTPQKEAYGRRSLVGQLRFYWERWRDG